MIGIGERIKELREDKGLTQEDLAIKFKVSRQSISGYENNTTEPSLSLLVQMADFFNVSTDYLLSRTKIKEIPTAHKPQNEILYRILDVLNDYKIMKK